MESWLIILVKSIILFFLTLILTRIIGKGNLSKIAPINFISYIVIAMVVSLISLNVVTNVPFALIVIGLWVVLPIVLDYISMKSKYFHNILKGKEKILIKNGKIMEENLSKVKLTGGDLLSELRSRNIFNLADVEFAVMEATGDINCSLKNNKKPVTAKDLGKEVSLKAESVAVIEDGNILNEGLTSAGFNKAWLVNKLLEAEIPLENVFIGQVDSSGDLYFDLFDDNLKVPQPKVKELLYANMEKCQADLISFSLETKDEAAKAMYLKNADKLKELIKKLKPYLLR